MGYLIMIAVVILNIVMFCTPTGLGSIVDENEKENMVAAMIGPMGDMIVIVGQIMLFMLIIYMFMLVLVDFCCSEEEKEEN